jgi:glycosyltransferase involved in cell wall biosynthesis
MRAFRLPLGRRDSYDQTPWNHPFLTSENIAGFRGYSEAVWSFALAHWRERASTQLDAGFAVNMAQTMYKWARLAQAQGLSVALYPSVMDTTAINMPEWEDFDGEYPDILDGEGFRRAHPELVPSVPSRVIPMDGLGVYRAYRRFTRGDRRPLHQLMAAQHGLRHEPLMAYRGVYPYLKWASALARHDVVCIASNAIPAYLCGRPYCAFSVGGDLQIDCGRADSYGEAMGLSFNAARFLLLSNPHALGHCRRLGFTNAVYLPYAMDDDRYCPGEGRVRRLWESEHGAGVYILTTCRIDSRVKGLGREVLDALGRVASDRPQARFVFLGWGREVGALRQWIARSGSPRQFIVLPPVGKTRLIDYYRSSDLILDQLVWGYYGATALEAAAVGKPVVMRIRKEHYAPLYSGDVAPIDDAGSPSEIRERLIHYVDHPGRRIERGSELRQWLVRNHGAARTVPLLLALLTLAADRAPLPAGLESPIHRPETEDERSYHARCRRRRGRRAG